MIGSWGLFLFYGQVRLGYVDGESVDSYTIREPSGRGYHTRAKRAVAIAPDILHKEDRAVLIDMALDYERSGMVLLAC